MSNKIDDNSDNADDRILFLNDVDESSANNIICSLLTLAQKDRKSPIYIIVNSYGGSVYDMLALYDAIRYVQSLGVPVNTIGLGKIMSCGFILLTSGTERKIGKNAVMMWHYPYDESLDGDILKIRNDLSELERLTQKCNDIISEHTNMNSKQISDMLTQRLDVYFTPEQAISLGIVDGYLEPGTPSTQSAKKNKITKKN